jgi:hypothetical protein
MLTRTHFAALVLGAAALPLTACFLTVTDGSSSGGAGGEDLTTSTTASGTTTAATGTTSSTGTGMSLCTDPAGTGASETKCDEMANFPSSSMCPDQSTPLAIDVCHKGYELYTAGSWEELQTCFENIPATIDDTCATNAQANVQACINTMYTDACANSDADQACNDTAQLCANDNDPNFTTDLCKQDLKPFSTAGLNAYIDCINAHSTTACADLHDTCMNEILAL